jgi:nucleoside-diphosphate-sugar epimerase
MTDLREASLVTGASGFLGRRLCERLQSEGERVIAMGRHPSDGPWDEFIQADLSSAELPAEPFKSVRTIYHLASKAHAEAETADEADAYRPVIVAGTRKLLEAAKAHGIKRFIYVSSVKAMGEGNPRGLPLKAIDESWPHTPQGPYGRAKVEAEKLVHGAGLPHAVVLRPTMVFGPGERGNLPKMIEAVRIGRFPPLPDTGNKRSMVHADDVVELILRAAIFPIAAGKTYIVSAPEAVSTRELYDTIRASLGMPPCSRSVPLSLLKVAALCGSAVGGVLGRRMPLDCETLDKLTGSAWYSAAKAQKELDYVAVHPVRDWLLGGN